MQSTRPGTIHDSLLNIWISILSLHLGERHQPTGGRDKKDIDGLESKSLFCDLLLHRQMYYSVGDQYLQTAHGMHCSAEVLPMMD